MHIFFQIRLAFAPAMEPSKKDHLHPLLADDSESSLPADHRCQPEKPKAPEVHTQPGLNKYAVAGAILASTNSVLLGYGN